MSENHHPNGSHQPQDDNWDEQPTYVVNDGGYGHPVGNGGAPTGPSYASSQPSWQQPPGPQSPASSYGQSGYVPPAGPPPAQSPYSSQNGYQRASYGSQPPPSWGGGVGYQQPQGGNVSGQPFQQSGANPWSAPGQSPNAYGSSPTWYGSTANSPALGQYAHWGKRVGAMLVDWAVQFPFLVLMVACFPRYVHYSDTDVTRQTGGSWPLTIVLYFVLMVFNCVNAWVLQGRSGQTIGKRVLKIKLVSEATGMPIGIGRAILRSFAHILDTLPLYIGLLWPLWDAKRQTFADKVMTSVVVEQPTR